MASQSGFCFDRTWTAAADLSTKQYYAVVITGQNLVNVAAAATDRVIGILQNDPKSGRGAEIRHLGTSLAVTDGSVTAIAPGDLLGPNAAGKLVKKATADFSVCAVANGASTTDGAIIEVMLIAPTVVRTPLG